MVCPGDGAVTEAELGSVVVAGVALELIQKGQAPIVDAVELTMDHGLTTTRQQRHRIGAEVVELGANQPPASEVDAAVEVVVIRLATLERAVDKNGVAGRWLEGDRHRQGGVGGGIDGDGPGVAQVLSSSTAGARRIALAAAR